MNLRVLRLPRWRRRAERNAEVPVFSARCRHDARKALKRFAPLPLTWVTFPNCKFSESALIQNLLRPWWNATSRTNTVTTTAGSKKRLCVCVLQRCLWLRPLLGPLWPLGDLLLLGGLCLPSPRGLLYLPGRGRAERERQTAAERRGSRRQDASSQMEQETTHRPSWETDSTGVPGLTVLPLRSTQETCWKRSFASSMKNTSTKSG